MFSSGAPEESSLLLDETSDEKRRPDVGPGDSAGAVPDDVPTTAGSNGGSLLDKVAASFGEFDLDSVQLIGGQEARGMSDAVGAHASATGNVIAAQQPDLFTLAHEAAHVIQQRGDPSGEAPDREAHANKVAEAVVAGESAEPLLADVASPQDADAAPGSVERLKKNGVAVDIATLDNAEAVRQLADAKKHGEGVVNGSWEFESGDIAALQAKVDSPTFGDPEITGLETLLSAGNATLTTVATDRHLAISLTDLAALHARLAAEPRVLGLREWTVKNSVYVAKILSADPTSQSDGANNLMDAMNELRAVEVALAASTDPSVTFDIRETAILRPNGTSVGKNADMKASTGAQTEVKTVRAPIAFNGLGGVKVQFTDALSKFASAGGGGPYKVIVFASFDEAGPKTTPIGPDKKTTSIDRTNNRFETTSTKPSEVKSVDIREDITAWLSRDHAANPASEATLFLENNTAGPTTMTWSHVAGDVWK